MGYDIATIIKTVSYWQMDRHINQWKKVEKSEIEHKHAQLIPDKGVRATHLRETEPFLQMVLQPLGICGQINEPWPKLYTLN